MTLFGISNRLLGKLCAEFQLEENEKEKDHKLDMTQIQLMEMDAVSMTILL